MTYNVLMGTLNPTVASRVDYCGSLFVGTQKKIILRQAWWRRSYDVIPHRPHRTDRETAA